MNFFQSLPKYETFIYTLPERYSAVVATTLVVVRRSARQASVRGEVFFLHGYRLVLSERMNFALAEYKRQRDPNGVPAAQALGAMLVGQHLNPDPGPIYGCYVIGREWFFMALDPWE